MRDGPIRRSIKALVRWTILLELRLRRGMDCLRGRRRWRLGGGCGGCARCCEAPSIQVGRVTWYFPTVRRLFLAWHRVINGFVLVESHREGRVFVFDCTHFDRQTRRCDSYNSRPAMCRDYPRALLAQPWPELFPGCGFRPVAVDGARQRAALEASGLPEEAVRELVERFRLE